MRAIIGGTLPNPDAMIPPLAYPRPKPKGTAA